MSTHHLPTIAPELHDGEPGYRVSCPACEWSQATATEAQAAYYAANHERKARASGPVAEREDGPLALRKLL